MDIECNALRECRSARREDVIGGDERGGWKEGRGGGQVSFGVVVCCLCVVTEGSPFGSSSIDLCVKEYVKGENLRRCGDDKAKRDDLHL